jgi:hypothetical protein
MRDRTLGRIAQRFPSRQSRFWFALLAALCWLWAAMCESIAAENDAATAQTQAPRPFEQSGNASQLAPPLDVDSYITRQPKVLPRQVNFQLPAPGTSQPRATQLSAPRAISPLIGEPPAAVPQPTAPAAQADPCAGVAEKPLRELGINISLPAGELPADHGSVCLASLSTPLIRSWPTYNYQWDATCLCHRPLYFEEINLERYGYGCGCCLQPLASAAHFFGTIPALPYCMAAECPHECVYTLGHYRPGSCPPWRCHWPPFDPLAAAAEGGVWTGMIFLIP